MENRQDATSEDGVLQKLTPAAIWNKQILKQLKSAFRRDPETDLSAQFRPLYARKLQILRKCGNIAYIDYYDNSS